MPLPLPGTGVASRFGNAHVFPRDIMPPCHPRVESRVSPVSTPARCLVLASASRHPEYAERKMVSADKPRDDVEADPRYRRIDLSVVHAYTARYQFAENIAKGEPGMRLAEAALLISAEDDAIASHSTVPFPVESFLARIEKMVVEIQRQRLQPMFEQQGEASADDLESMQQKVLREVEGYLFSGGLGYSTPKFGRSNIPANTTVDHPGVWEDARWAYLHELLIRRRGHPAAVAILYAEVMRRLLGRGSVDFAVSMDTKDFTSPPKAFVLRGLTRDKLILKSNTSHLGAGQDKVVGLEKEDEIALNTCTSETLAELLRFLKRAYWPFAWETTPHNEELAFSGCMSHGGFRAAAKAAAGEEMSAALRAVSTVANWRLERGIWTSPGAGDIRRCRAACERLVMLLGENDEAERRDLAMILVHSGELGAARAELRAHMSTNYFKFCDPFDKMLCSKVYEMLSTLNLEEPDRLMGIDRYLKGPHPSEMEALETRLPLTW